MVDAFGGRRVVVKPPERGIFALDHDGECKSEMKCIKENNADHFPCKENSKNYLKCRMDKNLMKSEDLNNLGLGDSGEYKRVNSDEGKKEKSGFVAGIGVKSSGKWLFW